MAAGTYTIIGMQSPSARSRQPAHHEQERYTDEVSAPQIPGAGIRHEVPGTGTVLWSNRGDCVRLLLVYGVYGATSKKQPSKDKLRLTYLATLNQWRTRHVFLLFSHYSSSLPQSSPWFETVQKVYRQAGKHTELNTSKLRQNNNWWLTARRNRARVSGH